MQENLGADMLLRPEEINLSLLKESNLFHVGSISLSREPSRSATLYALQKAKDWGITISYDPNYRETLWDNPQSAIQNMRSILPYVDIIKLSQEEILLLTGYNQPLDAAQFLISIGISIVAITLGSQGTLVCNKVGHQFVKSYPCHVVDTTGAGDSFWAGFLFQFIQCRISANMTSLEDIVSFAKFGNALASLCIEHRGGIPAMPDLGSVQKRLKKFENKTILQS